VRYWKKYAAAHLDPGQSRTEGGEKVGLWDVIGYSKKKGHGAALMTNGSMAHAKADLFADDPQCWRKEQ
jgi:hypothetical protein